MTNIFQLWERRLDPMTCEQVVAMARELPPQQGSVGHGGGGHAVNTNTRRSTVRWIHRDRPEWAYLFGTVDYLIQQGNRNAFNAVYDSPGPLSLQFTEYSAEDAGHYDWHMDLHWKTDGMKQRKLSLVILLSHPDEYDGGAFEMEDAQIDPVKMRAQGSAVLFPSYLRHRVTPVTRGTRISVVGWAEGPPYR